jgi:polysaccharide biosynthesis protein PelA
MINRKAKFKNSRNYILYYGRGKEDELSKYDVAIVEPQGQNSDTIELMHRKGTLVLAYVSAMEIIKTSPMFKFLRREDFLCINEILLTNEEYGTCLVNIKSRRWSTMLLQHIGNLITDGNYDGIFIDTLGDIEWDILSEEMRQDLLLATRALFNNIRSVFDDIIIIQNNGLHQVINYSLDLIDGICLENLSLDIRNKSAWDVKAINKLNHLINHQDIKILLLYEDNHFDASCISFFERQKPSVNQNKYIFYKTSSYTLL